MQAVIKRKTYLGYLAGVMNNKGSITMIFSFSTQICRGHAWNTVYSPPSASQKRFSNNRRNLSKCSTEYSYHG